MLVISVDSLQMVKECAQCSNGHHFCLLCLGIWALGANGVNDSGSLTVLIDQFNNTTVATTPATTPTPSWLQRLMNYFFPANTEVQALRSKLLSAIALPNTRYRPPTFIIIIIIRIRIKIINHRLNGSSSPVLTATCLSYGRLCDFLGFFSRTDLEVTPLDRF